MMNKFKPASKFRILAIISCALIIIGMALGTVFHFVSNGFFNFDGEYSSYKSVTVPYTIIEVASGEDEFDLETVCEKAFENAGVKYYLKKKDTNSISLNKQLEYFFKSSTDNKALNNAKAEINTKIAELDIFSGGIKPTSRADVHEHNTIIGGGDVTAMAAVVLATVLVAQVILTMIRYRFSAAIAAIAIDLHNLALYAALLALCRVPVSSAVMIFAVIITLATAIGVTYLLEKIKRNTKDNEKLSVVEVADLSAGQTLVANIVLPAFFIVVAVLLFAAMAVSAASIIAVLTPALLAIVGFVVTIYGTAFFAPAFYSCVKKIGNKISSKPSQKKGN